MKEHCNVCLKLIELKEQLEVCQPCSSRLLSGLSMFVLNKKIKVVFNENDSNLNLF